MGHAAGLRFTLVPMARLDPSAIAYDTVGVFQAARSHDGRWVVAAGEIDMVTAPRLAAAIEAAPCVGVDLGAVSFLDVSGLRVLLDAGRRAQAEGRQFAVARPSPLIRRLLAITAIDQSLEIVPDQGSVATSLYPTPSSSHESTSA
jgi:anti-sigma B factor antagonist